MSRPAITIDKLSKTYVLGRSSSREDTFRELLTGALRRTGGPKTRSFSALRNVTFDVAEGEVLGIIGRNGAGKSTLLKILSRITAPTSGSADLFGRVGSLLEIGTGFQPELSGRENIFLNGAIFGMKRAEMARKFDDIVAFADTEAFLDTPFKRYSSGMKVRLGFAVAANLETDILIVDEALAVGDAAFQRKCITKMKDVTRQGRTVLLVTHNMGLIKTLTDRAVFLQRGEVAFIGSPDEAIARYLGDAATHHSVDLTNHPNRPPGMAPSLVAARITDAQSRPRDVFSIGEEWFLELDYDCPPTVQLQGAGFNIVSASGILVGGVNTFMLMPPPHRVPSSGRLRFRIEQLPLCPGSYTVSVGLSLDPHHLHDNVQNALAFNVERTDVYGTGYQMAPEHGLCAFKSSYEAQVCY